MPLKRYLGWSTLKIVKKRLRFPNQQLICRDSKPNSWSIFSLGVLLISLVIAKHELYSTDSSLPWKELINDWLYKISSYSRLGLTNVFLDGDQCFFGKKFGGFRKRFIFIYLNVLTQKLYLRKVWSPVIAQSAFSQSIETIFRKQYLKKGIFDSFRILHLVRAPSSKLPTSQFCCVWSFKIANHQYLSAQLIKCNYSS